MAFIEYIAKRTFAGGHAANEKYVIELEVSEAIPDTQIARETARSAGGAAEHSFERIDTFWRIAFAPVNGLNRDLMRELLDSTESGETFRVWLWDEDSAPLVLKRLEDGHTEPAFMRCGDKDLDYFSGEFTALQVGAYDVAGAGAGGGGFPGGGGVGGGSETIDIYDGAPFGFDQVEPGAVVPDIGPFTITVGQQLTDHGFITGGGGGLGSIDSDGGDLPIFSAITNATFDYVFVAIVHPDDDFFFADLMAKYSSITFSGGPGTLSLADATVGTDNADTTTFEWPYAGADWSNGSSQTITFNP